MKLRILGAVSDLPAAYVRYHVDCGDQFMPVRNANAAANTSVSVSTKPSVEEEFLLNVSVIGVISHEYGIL